MTTETTSSIESYMIRSKLRVQFTRHEEEITNLVLQGYTYSSIHKRFYEEGKITVKYNFFAKFLERKFGPIKGANKKRTRLISDTSKESEHSEKKRND